MLLCGISKTYGRETTLNEWGEEESTKFPEHTGVDLKQGSMLNRPNILLNVAQNATAKTLNCHASSEGKL